MLQVLERRDDLTLTITGSTADVGGTELNEQLQAFADGQGERMHFTPSLGQLRYLSLVRYCATIIGNSSSGLIEVPALGVPTINIGPRQRNRLCADSVISCANDATAIGQALDRTLSDAHRAQARQTVNPYGTAGAAGRITDILRRTALDDILFKHFPDWPETP